MSVKSNNKFRNRLASESSPYLLQHAMNPVDWYPWGEEALVKARQEDKLILISIGYSACHWCHVMEHQSFEDEEVARIMNQHFVCIKVDREERPDVDQVYMDAVQLLTRRGGWPLNCFALPDGTPVYGGTYFTRENWMQLLHYLADTYKNERENVLEQGRQLKEGVILSDLVRFRPIENDFKEEDVDQYISRLKKDFDHLHGGVKGAPKFPMPTIWLLLNRYTYYTKDKETRKYLKFTLDKLANGGIYDHVGGGFSRYSVDEKWFVPHFEKMLYDNAQLMSLYSEAYQVYHDSRYKEVVYEMFEFLNNWLLSAEGLFYSSLDADSEGEEGSYYVWAKDDLDKLLGENASFFCAYYNITDRGNWEYRKNILYVNSDMKSLCAAHGLKMEEGQEVIATCKSILSESREDRIPPGLDDKALASWNGLIVKGLIDAYKAFGDPVFLDKARNTTDFVLEYLVTEEGGLFRTFKNGNAKIHGFLDDYAIWIDTLIAIYSVTYSEKWLTWSKNLTNYVLENFYEPEKGMFYYTHKEHQELIVRKMEIMDNVIPSSNSIMGNNLFVLSKYFNNEKYLRLARQMLSNVIGDMVKHSRYYSNWGRLLVQFVYNNKELVVAGERSSELMKEINKTFHGDTLLAGVQSESDIPLLQNKFVSGRSYIYVCKNKNCELPVETVPEALGLLD